MTPEHIRIVAIQNPVFIDLASGTVPGVKFYGHILSDFYMNIIREEGVQASFDCVGINV